MYGKRNNQCSRKSLGMYYATVGNFVKGYTRQKDANSEFTDDDYDVPDEIEYTDCTAYYGDDDGGSIVYLQLGCNGYGGKAIAIKAYEDAYCNTPMGSNFSTNNLGIDISDLGVKFETCTDCVSWPAQSDDDANAADVDDNFWATHAYDSPMCGAAWNTKEKCGRKCQRAIRKSSTVTKEGFTPLGKFFLFLFSVSGLFLILAVHSQRKRMATEDALAEENIIKRAGIQMKHVVFGMLGLILCIVILMALKFKRVTWTLLIGSNICLFSYWASLRFRKEGKVEVGGFKLYGDTGPIA